MDKQQIVNVKPLKTKEEIDDFRWALRKMGMERNLVMFNVGINTGLRISDIVKLKVEDVRGKKQLLIIEQKTRKPKNLRIPKDLREMLQEYTRGMQPKEYLFKSTRTDSHITTTQAYRVLQRAADLLGRDDIGTHTMRKTFGYMHYKRFKDVATLQKIFNHSHPAVTLRYIGIEQEEIDDTMEDFSI